MPGRSHISRVHPPPIPAHHHAIRLVELVHRVDDVARLLEGRVVEAAVDVRERDAEIMEELRRTVAGVNGRQGGSFLARRHRPGTDARPSD